MGPIDVTLFGKSVCAAIIIINYYYIVVVFFLFVQGRVSLCSLAVLSAL